jgi:hypothetical protein
MKIIYKTPENTVTILSPTQEWTGTMEELAQKDVPTGLKYKIVEDGIVPSDRSFRDAWEVDEVELTDGVGGEPNNTHPIADVNKVIIEQEKEEVQEDKWEIVDGKLIKIGE